MAVNLAQEWQFSDFHPQKNVFAPGTPDASEVSGTWDANLNSGYRTADSNWLEDQQTRPGAPDAGAPDAGSCRHNISEHS